MTRSEHEIKQNSRRILINWYPDGEDGGPRHSVIKRLDQVNGIVLPAEVSFSNWHGYHSPQQARRHIAEVRVVLDVAEILDRAFTTKYDLAMVSAEQVLAVQLERLNRELAAQPH